MKFEELDLNDNVLDALYDMHFDECTPVQENCIPEILKGRDLMGVAQTGTGKTAAYLLPILSLLDDGGYPKDAVNCVIMSPTRELAQQIDQAMQGFAYHLPEVSSVAVYGGNDGNRYDQEMKSMRLGADVIIATPGRLISHISMGNIDLGKVSFFVLDEADRMLDMGFSDDIMKIASKLPKTCQTIMFSATMPKEIEKLAQSLLKNPVEIKLAVSKPAEKIKQSAYICYETQKLQIIKSLFKAGDLERVIIFSGSKQKVKQINQALTQIHINSGEMHSDLDQAQRDDIMFKFKSGQIDVLVATDIVARGIDIDDIAMVINYDVPHDAEDYVHRIGRTARAKRDGVAYTFVNENDMYSFHLIEKFLEKDIDKNPLPEGCGEGPEYTTARTGKRTPAKKRRQNDRDETSHKKTKQRNRSRAEGGRAPRAEKPEDGQAQQAQGDEQRNQQRREDKPQREQQAQDEQREGAAAQDGTPQERSSRNRGRNNRNRNRDNAQSPSNAEGQAAQSQGEERQGNRSRNNRRRGGNRQNGERQGESRQGDNRQERNGKQGNRRGGEQGRAGRGARDGKPASAAADKQDGGIKSLIKKPLKWLKSFGKK